MEDTTPATITTEEEKILSSALAPEYRLLLRFILESGCTISEACTIECPEKDLGDHWKSAVLHDPSPPRIENIKELQFTPAASGENSTHNKNIYNYGSGFALTLSLSLLSDEPETEEKTEKNPGPKGIIPVHVHGGRKKRGSGRSAPRTVFCSRSLLIRIMKRKTKEAAATASPSSAATAAAAIAGASTGAAATSSASTAPAPTAPTAGASSASSEKYHTAGETLFCAPTGCSLSRERVSMHLIRVSEKVLGKRVTPAVLRHTCAARLFNSGADINLVCRYLGHSVPSVTAGLYFDSPGFPLPHHGAPVKGYNDPWISKLCRYLRSHSPTWG
ncbi:MAG: tyrosine-type recombinase/integrase [Sediminispirochaetaceae bacterium]